MCNWKWHIKDSMNTIFIILLNILVTREYSISGFRLCWCADVTECCVWELPKSTPARIESKAFQGTFSSIIWCLSWDHVQMGDEGYIVAHNNKILYNSLTLAKHVVFWSYINLVSFWKQITGNYLQYYSNYIRHTFAF